MRREVFDWTRDVMSLPVKQLPAAACKVAWCLAEFADSSGVAWPKLETIRNAVGLANEKSVRDHVAALERLGWLVVEDRRHFHEASRFVLTRRGQPVIAQTSTPVDRNPGSTRPMGRPEPQTRSIDRNPGPGVTGTPDPVRPEPGFPIDRNSGSQSTGSPVPLAATDTFLSDPPGSDPPGSDPREACRARDTTVGAPSLVTRDDRNGTTTRGLGIPDSGIDRVLMRRIGDAYGVAFRKVTERGWVAPTELADICRGSPLAAHRVMAQHLEVLTRWAQGEPDPDAAITAALAGAERDDWMRANGLPLAALASSPGRYAAPRAPPMRKAGAMQPPAPASAFRNTPITPETFARKGR